MKRRNSVIDRSNVLIELTPLLDVIFILLFIVMIARNSEMQQREEALQAQLEEANLNLVQVQQELQDTNAIKQTYADMLDTFTEFSSYASPVTIYVSYDYDDVRQRKVWVTGAAFEMEPVSFSPANENNAWARLTSALSTHIEEMEEANIPVILSCNHEQILRRDEEKVQAIMEEIAKEHSNVYLK